MSRELLKWALYGVAALVALAPPKAPSSPPKPPKGTSPPGPKGGPSKPPPRGGDVISYYFDSTLGVYIVKTHEAPDVDWGAPELAASKIPAYQTMVKRWGALVDDAGVDFRVPSNEIFSVMWSESGGLPNLTSSVGAKGLMQVMPFNFPKGTTTAQMFDPKTNIRRGTALLAQARANGTRDLVQMASMYNAGPPAGPPRTNDQAPSIATRWGYVAQPGYIDSVVAAFNTGAKLKVA